MLQDTNNVVVRIGRDVVAKVGVWPHSVDVLAQEVAVSSALHSLGAPVAEPLGDLMIDEPSGAPVSLWRYLQPIADPPSPAAVATMLRDVHDALLQCGGMQLPSFWLSVDLARAALGDDVAMSAMPPAGLAFLRTAFELVSARVAALAMQKQRPLHGEPHANNVVTTSAGPHLVDFEAASVGPVEWDLASVDPAVVDRYEAPVRDELLAALRLLSSARVATWGWRLAHHPDMRRHGAHHLAVLRSAIRDSSA